jgi:hypothetical protein
VSFLLLFFLALPALAADTLAWDTKHDRVTADIKSTPLFDVLDHIAGVTGWTVFVEPDTARRVSVKFKDLPPGEALHLMLGELNYVLIPGTNVHSGLYVFRTTRQNATQIIRAAKPAAQASAKPKIMPNELILRLKPGAKIDDIARLLGAKVIGRIDSLNAYRLQFNDQDSTDAARQQLASNADVASVENNIVIDRPESATPVAVGAPPLNLQLSPPPASGRIQVGLLDTALQPLGNGLDAFVEKQVSLAGDPQLDPSTPSHGTLMAETILSTLQQVDQGKTSVQILPVDFFGSDPSGNSFTLAQGFAYLVNNGANPINMSVGSKSDSQLLSDLIAQANQQGIVVYAAKGNDGPSTEPTFPAADKYANPVTALDRNGQVYSWANQAAIPAIGALGAVVLPFGAQSFLAEGTSPATAIVTGTAAGLMDKNGISSTAANGLLLKGPTATTIPGK